MPPLFARDELPRVLLPLREELDFAPLARDEPDLAVLEADRPELDVDDLPRLEAPDLAPPDREPEADLLALEREPDDLEPPLDARLLPLPDRAPPDEPDPLSLSVHLPDSTRCAASATASAMMEPRRVALDITEDAACEAVSAASRPASRIFRRAPGLALIAAAAAARPAASISLLIAAFAILSIVLSLLLPDERDEDFEEPLLELFAIGFTPSVAVKDTSKP